MKRQFIIPAILCGLATVAVAQTDSVLRPVGVFREIDIARHSRAIELLSGADEKDKQQVIDSILLFPNRYNPPVLYALSRELFQKEKKKEAMYWFYLAQLRARYDANRCADSSAQQGVMVLNFEYGPVINVYAFENIDLLKTTVERVIEFVRTNDEDYDQRWLNLHGMWAVTASLGDSTEVGELSLPREQWKEIKAKTINDYQAGFQKALEMFKEQ
jgi:hypothetical protein